MGIIQLGQMFTLRRGAALAVCLLALSTSACVVEPAPGPVYDGVYSYPEYPYYYGPEVGVGLGYGYGHGGWGRGGWYGHGHYYR